MKTTALFVVAGMAAAASAQTMFISWSVADSADGDPSEINGSALLTMSALMDPGATGFAGSIYDITGDAEWAAGSVDAFDNLLDALTDDGTLGGGNSITGIESFQLPPLFNGDFVADNPITLYTMTWTPAAYNGQSVSGGTSHLNFDVYTDDLGTSESYTGDVSGFRFTVAPAPASMALLGLGGLVAGRRRR